MVDELSIEYSLEEEICETQYENTHYRTEEGRYVVQLPFKNDPYCLVTIATAVEQFLASELKKLPGIKKLLGIPTNRNPLTMKRATPLISSNPRAKRVCFDKDNGKVSSFKPDAVPENHFHLGGPNYAVVFDFACVARIHSHRYKLDATGSLLPTKDGIHVTPSVWLAPGAHTGIFLGGAGVESSPFLYHAPFDFVDFREQNIVKN
ncbi:PC4 domain-containing protein [Trichonephila clavipes]|nr:PC4 domain-containing protein [Trichonephila clavipes]